MNKLISNPFECGYVDQEPNYRDDRCRHPHSKGTIVCPGELEFPTNCPLQDGFTRIDLLAAVKTAPVTNTIESNIVKELCGNTYSHKCIKCHLIFRDGIVYLSRKDCICPTCLGKDTKPKRRNRKDCEHYERIPLGFGNNITCSAPWRSVICQGVNCGKFKTK